jgi:hypothetical protein
MEYFYFFLFIAFLVGTLIFLTRMEARAKIRQKKAAYELLEQKEPSTQEIKRVLKGLRLYGGRWRKDKEFQQLIVKLEERLKNAGE